MKTIWHVKDKRHYIVESETSSYYFVRVGTEKNFTVKRVHKKFCVDKQPIERNTFTITVGLRGKTAVHVDTVSRLTSEEFRDNIRARLNDRSADFISFGYYIINKSDISYVRINDAKP